MNYLGKIICMFSKSQSPIQLGGPNSFKNIQPTHCLVLFVSSTRCKDNTRAHICLPWWLADPPSPGRVVDSTPPKHQLPAGSKTNLQRGSQGSQQLIFFWTVNRNLKYRDACIQAWRILSLPVCVEVTLLIMPQKPVCLFWSSPRWNICLLVMAILERQKKPLFYFLEKNKWIEDQEVGGIINPTFSFCWQSYPWSGVAASPEQECHYLLHFCENNKN